MTPEERQLITDLFERLRSYEAPDKDREADDLINRSVRAYPNAPYLLVQSVIVQEQALQQADERIRELEARLRDFEEPRARSQGSFLGGAAGRTGSVPQVGVGARATPPLYGAAQSPWGQQVPPAAQPAPAQGGGGFLRTALSAAAGVAGGMLLADGIRNMLGGSSAHAAGLGGGALEDRHAGGGSSGGDSDAGYAKEHGYVDEANNDPGGSSWNDGNDPGFGGGGDDGLDI